VAAPKPGSAPSQEFGLDKVPLPLVETYHTKYADSDDIKKIKEAIIIFTWLGRVLPVA
tara:strand:- start:582 stop:755 length:174 start_codon:yes stop_codon:yes gene_type:complete